MRQDTPEVLSSSLKPLWTNPESMFHCFADDEGHRPGSRLRSCGLGALVVPHLGPEEKCVKTEIICPRPCFHPAIVWWGVWLGGGVVSLLNVSVTCISIIETEGCCCGAPVHVS